ncbi:MAG: methyltransferase [Pedobacter sp.]|nr:methyltransferase [Chitinophagaceae bacterium]
MNSTIALKTFQLNNFAFELFVPSQQAIQQNYLQQKLVAVNTPFPYWAKVWAASVGLGYFINQQPEYVQNKTVFELAAGLGLPSLVAAKWATSVCCSDYLQAPLNVVKASANHYQIKNISYKIIDWFNMPNDIATDVLLLSDINYEPTCFATLLSIVQQFLAKGTTIILSTPQRLLAKPFIEKLLPFCSLQQTVEVIENGNATWVQILVLTAI